MLEDHVVLVAGAGSGLGLGVARYCAGDGAQVAVLDNSADKLATLDGEFHTIQADVTRLADITAARASIMARFGRVDAVIACQGIFDGNVPLAEIPAERVALLFDEIFHVNVLGSLHLAKVFHDDVAATNGALVLTASTAAYAADGGGACYSASKGAIAALIQQLAFEFAPKIRVNGVAPAGIAKSQLRGPATLGMDGFRQSDIPPDAFLEVFRRISLLQELPSPHDYAPLYAFLASRHNLVMTGQMIVADQGMLNRHVLTAPTPPRSPL